MCSTTAAAGPDDLDREAVRFPSLSVQLSARSALNLWIQQDLRILTSGPNRLLQLAYSALHLLQLLINREDRAVNSLSETSDPPNPSRDGLAAYGWKMAH